ncbi:bifunctional diaminohydroxyphosphoribosylaminopyrimidine deaminase/5-amino-6-(5-phosphoribosylamino)uracil reductase RibD [Gulosibacter sp. ACHW.36C]|uniref:Riboflavin biosynthesis protein RibD n=1 Tax=Gulosibacter sediminis TaxID=1729695 RepID=A0ABY4MY58_9MICO|nr:bifunctional diaminohydroxyphosphoribosylaminopyrimidine deaminase/5-amino-6-(5-phosphoribosylamino)uracil reductase RibD [Gulosibacter sediminis]UQN15366.1 bifunctional diaminohydroxyphosphoribosylaminopyrimidine deaminase/5-amino-6-(5-phosphoribosylamino)uracil reductase RibD [Gulosibacter sediminis]
MQLTPVDAMRRAIELAARGPERGPNPRVGAVLLAPGPASAPREVLGEGWHRGAGTAHAEVAALADARARGLDVRGATAVVTLEPCNHTGRTGPCVDALLDAGIDEVIYAVDDPNPAAAGGAARLRAAGATVYAGLEAASAGELIRAWATPARLGRPFVTLKLALTLDGKIAAADGTSQWITSPAARAHAHGVRGRVDAIAVGTGTALADDPALTARTPEGALLPEQPVRVVLGARELPASAQLRAGLAPLLQLRTHDVTVALAELAERHIHHVLVEGGATVAAALLRADVVDELHVYLAPLLLGEGTAAVAPFGVSTLANARRWRFDAPEPLGPDVFLRARRATDPTPEGA